MRSNVLAGCLLLALAAPMCAQALEVVVTDAAGLRAAITTANANPNRTYEIRVDGDIGINTALPPITGNVTIFGGNTISADGEGFRAFTVNGGTLDIVDTTIEGFQVNGDGGAVLVTAGTASAHIATFLANGASGDGGAMTATGNGKLDVHKSNFFENEAGGDGGAIATFSSERSQVSNTIFAGNCAADFGAALDVNGIGGLRIEGGTFDVPTSCGVVVIENPVGPMLMSSNTLFSATPAKDGIHSTGQQTSLVGNILQQNGVGPEDDAKILCADFGSGAIRSLGANIVSDSSCALNQPGDMPNGNAQLGARTSVGVYPIAASSPAVERGGATMVPFLGRSEVRCGVADVRGLGRPQDNDNDGLYECDTGSYEVQAGPNLVPGHTMTVFDPARSGEGATIEILDGGLATVSMFTFGPTGGAAWFVGVGRVVGNSVVVDSMTDARGGTFGPNFNPANIDRRNVGSMSFVFSDCAASARPGNMSFDSSLVGGYTDITAKASRLSTVIGCSNERGPRVARSGSFFDPARSGEGVIVQHLTDGRVVLVYYGFDQQGRQIWLISAATTVNGDTITANMVYPAGTTRFGTQFNPANVRLDPWGTFTLTYTGCNQLRIDYASTVNGYGNGTFNLQRLSRPTGIGCN